MIFSFIDKLGKSQLPMESHQQVRCCFLQQTHNAIEKATPRAWANLTSNSIHQCHSRAWPGLNQGDSLSIPYIFGWCSISTISLWSINGTWPESILASIISSGSPCFSSISRESPKKDFYRKALIRVRPHMMVLLHKEVSFRSQLWTNKKPIKKHLYLKTKITILIYWE